MSRLGEKIKMARESHGLNEKHLAKKCGVAESFIKEVESGKKVATETLINQISKILNVNLNEETVLFALEEKKQEEETVEKIIAQKKTIDMWEDAFSSLQKKIPIFEMDLRTITGYKVLPLIDKKIEGFAPDSILYVKATDNSMKGYRIQKNDIIMVLQTKELINNSIMLIKECNEYAIRKVQKLDAKKVLLVGSSGGQEAVAREIRDIQFVGKCVKVEWNL